MASPPKSKTDQASPASSTRKARVGGKKTVVAEKKVAQASATARAAKAKPTAKAATAAKTAKAQKADKAKADKAKADKAKADKAKADKAKAGKTAAPSSTKQRTTKATSTRETKPAKPPAAATKKKAAKAAPARAPKVTKAKSEPAEPAKPAKPTKIVRPERSAKTARGATARGAAPARRPSGYPTSVDALFEVGRERMGLEHLRPGQPEALEHILAKRDVLAVMPTGSGKSLLYQLPSLILPGITVVVSPLIALIKDQIDKMKKLGVAVCRADSTLTVKQKREMEALVRAPGGKLLLTTPERISMPDFREFLLGASGDVGVSLFVVDEAHCVSQWGHDFRPAYLSIRQALDELGRPPVLATTATAPPHVREDILHQLGMPEAKIVTTTFDRPNLHYEVIALPGDDDKNKTLVTLLKKLPRPGIVYCATVKMVETLHESLSRHGIPMAKYHGRLTKKQRDDEQARFMEPGSSLVMVATNAFGLGVDKADIRNVLHYHVPGSLEAYAQEAGRGGRDGKPARCVLLFSPDDVAIQEFFLKGTYPTRRQVRSVFRALEAFAEQAAQSDEGAEPTISNIALSARVGTQRTRTVLNLLKDEGFVVENESGGLFRIATPAPDLALLNEKAKQYEARRIADRQRLDALLEYVGAPGCRNQVILTYLGESDPPLCGRCDNCLRSKEAAIEASRDARRLEANVTRELDADWSEEDGPPETRRVIRHRVVRIDTPAAGEAADEPRAAKTRVERRAEKDRDELARLIAHQEADARAGAAASAAAAAELAKAELAKAEVTSERRAEHADAEYEDDGEYEDGEYEDGEYEDGEYEDDDEYEDGEYEDDDEYEDDEDDDVEAIERTAAALAEEGVEYAGGEITILARKKVPKPPKGQKKVAEAEESAKPKRRRRRRRKKSTLPPKSAFVSPVLSKGGPQVEQRRGPSGPLVEYVRGPMRINMTPVASATPNDGPPRKKKRRRIMGGPGGGPAARPGPRPGPSAGLARGPFAPRPAPAGAARPTSNGGGPPGENGEPGKKKRRRRRRKRKGAGGAPQQLPDGPVSFFSVAGGNGGGGGGGGASGSNGGNQPQPGGPKKKRRRRRRRGKGGGGQQAAAPPPPSDG